MCIRGFKFMRPEECMAVEKIEKWYILHERFHGYLSSPPPLHPNLTLPALPSSLPSPLTINYMLLMDTSKLESPLGQTLCCSAVNFAPSMTCVLKRHDSSSLFTT